MKTKQIEFLERCIDDHKKEVLDLLRGAESAPVDTFYLIKLINRTIRLLLNEISLQKAINEEIEFISNYVYEKINDMHIDIVGLQDKIKKLKGNSND